MALFWFIVVWHNVTTARAVQASLIGPHRRAPLSCEVLLTVRMLLVSLANAFLTTNYPHVYKHHMFSQYSLQVNISNWYQVPTLYLFNFLIIIFSTQIQIFQTFQAH